MRKIVIHSFGEPTVMQVETVATPSPGADEILVKMSAIGINPVDTYIRSGKYGNLPQLPYTPGFDGAGTIVAMGKNITRYALGERVYLSGSISGTYADHALCTVDQVHLLPAGLTFAQGAALGIPYATAWRALFQIAQVRPGQTLLIRGASGGVGIATTQLAQSAGLHVVGTAGSDSGKRLVASNGADLVVNHDAISEIMHFTNGVGPNVIIEMLANVNLQSDIEIAARWGTVVIVGNRGTVSIDPRLIMSKELTLRGVLLLAAASKDLREIHDGLAPRLRDGTVKPVISKEFMLDEAAAAHDFMMNTPGGGKCILLP